MKYPGMTLCFFRPIAVLVASFVFVSCASPRISDIPIGAGALSLNEGRYGHAVVSLGDSIYVLAGLRPGAGAGGPRLAFERADSGPRRGVLVMIGLLTRAGFTIRDKTMQDGVIGTYLCVKSA